MFALAVTAIVGRDRGRSADARQRARMVAKQQQAAGRIAAATGELPRNIAERLSQSPRTVRVDLNGHGAWEITLPAQLDPINCESLYEARRAAYRFAAHWHPCEVVMCDAYHRVMHRQLIDSYEDAAG
jgi:hypothetical protein